MSNFIAALPFISRSSKRWALAYISALSIAMSSAPAQAEVQVPAGTDISELRQQLEALRSEQQRTAERMAELELALSQLEAGTPIAPRTVTASAPPVRVRAPQAASPIISSRLNLSGDLRLRYEANFSDPNRPNRDRGALRARLRASYAVANGLEIGGQLVTGDPDDPNSADITLSNFDDDLQVSLDQVWARATVGNLVLQGGKLPLPFNRTDLVWDGDISPQGASAMLTMPLSKSVLIKAAGLYFLVDEAVAGKDSRMIGSQISVEAQPARNLTFGLSAAYYDYRLNSLAGGDAGDFRSNLFAQGRYLSDYNLLDVIGTITWSGAGARWPVRLTADYVHNYGAAVDGDNGVTIDLAIGKASQKGDLRFSYGYAQAGVDAVFAAFSHDNIDIATNYMQHALSAEYVPLQNVTLNATLYHYRAKSTLYALTSNAEDWRNRLRLNVLFSF